MFMAMQIHAKFFPTEIIRDNLKFAYILNSVLSRNGN